MTHDYPEWNVLQPNFKYHGRNVYAYLLLKYGETKTSISKMNKGVRDDNEGEMNIKNNENNEVNEKRSKNVKENGDENEIDKGNNREKNETDIDGKSDINNKSVQNINNNSINDDIIVDTFDFITVQLYEGYSHTYYETQILNEDVTYVLHNLIKSLINGWVVNFSTDLHDLSTTLQENVNDDGNDKIKTIENSDDTNSNLVISPPPPPSSSLSSSYSSSSSSSSSSLQKRVFVKNTQLVIGLANGWAGDGKFLLLDPEKVKS